MPARVRASNATIRWLTHPPEGAPRLTVGSHTFAAVPLAIDSDAPHPLATSPGELLAGAFGSIFAWQVAEELLAEQTPARELVVEVGLTAEMPPEGENRDIALREIACAVEARLPGLAPEHLQAIAERIGTKSAQSLGLRPDIAIRVSSTVVGG